jgi:cytidine deaminase
MKELTDADRDRLVSAAKLASRHTYSPYSRFPVGAAVLDASGEVFAGTNVENASFGLTICAERSAIIKAVSAGRREIEAVVIYTPTDNPTVPCGACRQVINEFNAHAMVISVCDGPAILRMSIDDLLPRAFGPTDLKA